MNSSKNILVYGVEPSKILFINSFLSKNRLPSCTAIDDSVENMIMSDILNNPIKSVNAVKSKETIIIFNNLSQVEMSTAITLVKKVLKPKPIFAAITPNSIDWTFSKLKEELISEKKFFEGK